MYPQLNGEISNEAAAYDRVATAIDGVVASLKQKIILQAKEDILSRSRTEALKYQSQLSDYEKKQTERGLKIDAKYKTNASTAYTDEEMEELYKLNKVYGSKFSEWKDGKDNKLKKKVEELAKKKNIKYDNNFYKATKELVGNYQEVRATINGLTSNIDKITNEGLDEADKIEENLGLVIDKMEKASQVRKNQKLKNAGKKAGNKIESTLGNAINEIEKEKEENDTYTQKLVKETEQLLSNWKNGKYKNSNLKELREVHKKISASGIDPVTASEIHSRITELESLEGKTEKSAKAIKKHSKSIVKSANDIYNAFQKDMQNQIDYDDILGTLDVDKIKNQVSILKRYIKEAIDNGQIDLAKSLQIQLQEKEFKIKKFDIDEALDKVQEKIEDLEINFSKGKISEENYHDERAKILRNLIKTYEKHNINLDKLSEEDAKHLREVIEMAKQKKKASEDEVENLQRIATKLKKVNEALDSINSLASSFSQLGQVTGSRSIGNIGGILSNIFNMGTSFNNLGDIKSITKIFSGGLNNFTPGMNSLSSLVGIATGGLGIAKSIGSIIGFGRGKNKSAEIDNRNKENENRYQEQIKAMQTLTEALKRNTDYIKNFTDRILTEAAKNPTLSFLRGSDRNLDLFQQAMLNGKHFNDISAIEKGSERYRKGFGRRKKSKDTYTAVNVGEAQLLKYLGFDKTELDAFTDNEMRQLNNALKNVNHNDLVNSI